MYKLLPEHEAQIPAHTAWWISNALATSAERYSTEKRAHIVKTIKHLYEVSGLKEPVVETCDGPVSGAVAYGVLHVLFSSSLTRDHSALMTAREVCDWADKDTGTHATRECVERVLRTALPDAVSWAKDLGETMLTAATRALDARDGGNESSGEPCLLSLYRTIVEIDKIEPGLTEKYLKLVPFEEAAKFGTRYLSPGGEFCLVSELPTVLRVDSENRLHSESGPAKAWHDGEKIYAWHGTVVPAEWIEHPNKIPVATALNHPNVEMRRVAAEIMGWDRVLSEMSTTTVDHDEKYGTLLEVEIESEPARFLRVRCPTGRAFALGVPVDVASARAASDWLTQWDEAMPEPEFRT